MNEVCISLLVLLTCQYVICLQETCPQGHRLSTSETGSSMCLPCYDGVTFMSEENHTHRQCQACSRVENPDLELVVSECNRTHDTVILCRPGHYRNKAKSVIENDKCEKCRECQFPARVCHGFYDSICCLSGQEAIKIDGRIFACNEGPFLCGQGYYFSTSTKECLSCPEGTFMNEDNHKNIACRKCDTLSEGRINNSLIVHPCNRTSPTLFGCEDGYFRDPAKDSLTVEVECSPCQKCAIATEQCDMYHDTVCLNSDYTTGQADHHAAVMDHNVGHRTRLQPQVSGHSASKQDQTLRRLAGNLGQNLGNRSNVEDQIVGNLTVNQHYVSGHPASNEDQSLGKPAGKEDQALNVTMQSGGTNDPALNMKMQSGDKEDPALNVTIQSGDKEDPALNVTIQSGDKEDPALNVTIQSGDKEDPALNVTIQSGNKEDPALNVTIQSGNKEDPALNVTMQSGNKEDPALNSSIQSGDKEDPALNATIQSDDKEDPALNVTIQSGGKEDPALNVTMQSGNKEDSALNSSIQSGEKEDSALNATIQSGDKEDPALNVTIQSGGKEDPALNVTMQSGNKEDSALNATIQSGWEKTTVCGDGFYLYINISNGGSTCKPCDNDTSTTNTRPFCEDCVHQRVDYFHPECHSTKDLYNGHTNFRIFSILLFSLAVLIDVFYVFLYGRNFLRKSIVYFSRMTCSQAEEDTSRIIGTIGIDLHVVFICVHLFGILCEVNVVKMDEDVLWKFTVIMGIVTVIVYFFDAMLFLLVKRVLCVKLCISHRRQDVDSRVHYRSGETHAFLDST